MHRQLTSILENDLFSTVDSIFNRASLLKQTSNFPAYEITRNTQTKEIFIKLALAGYEKEDIAIKEENGLLVVSSIREKKNTESHEEISNEEYLSNSKLAKRNFLISFNIPNLIVSKPATFKNGLLVVTLEPSRKQANAVTIE
jgi:HSP20 family molecular chaperone IbpA